MYFRARYYDPQTGEFISRDPLGYVDGMSLYRGYFFPGSVDPLGLMDGRKLIGYIYHFESDKTVYLGLSANLNSRGFKTHTGITGDRGLGLGNGWNEKGAKITVYNVYANASCKDVNTAILVAEKQFGDHHGIVKSGNGWSEPNGRTVQNSDDFLSEKKLKIAQGENFGTTSPGRAKGFTFHGPDAHAQLNAVNKLVPMSAQTQKRVKGLPVTGRGSNFSLALVRLG